MNTNYANFNQAFPRKMMNSNSSNNFNLNTEENRTKTNGRAMLFKNTFKPPSSREFGRDLTNILTQGHKNTKLTFHQTKLNNFPKKEPVKTKEANLYSLRSRTSTANLNLKTKVTLNEQNKENIYPSMNTMSQIETGKSFLLNKKESFEMDVDKEINNFYTNEIKNHLLIEENIENFPDQSENYLNNNSNPQKVPEYLEEICTYLKEIEPKHFNGIDYMKYQKDINEKMRAILFDWLVDVHLKFKLLPETLFLTIQIVDRFLCKKEVNRNKLQLVGVSALFIACKYEEIYPPELKDFVYVTDKAYTNKEILKMERIILMELSFDICYPTALRFLEIFIEVSQCPFDEDSYVFARYLLELFLVEYKSIYYLPSLIAASSLFLTFKICKSRNKKFSPVDLSLVTGYSEEKIRDCARDILVVLDGVQLNPLQAVKNKFSQNKFMEVAKVKN